VSEGDPHATISDSLTGAYSRALLGPRMAEELSRAARSNAGCAVFLFDVDYFKSVNDAYGHARGDEVLCQIVQRTADLLRGYDVLFRYGGDEFVLLLPDTARADAVRVALRLVEGIRNTPFSGDPPLNVSVSLGVAAFPEDATEPEALLAVADRRNYLAKQRGRACAVADDATEATTRSTSSRLLERDIPLAAVHHFLTRLLAERRGALRVWGEPGAGHSRFLEEVSRAARLRGFAVLDDAAADVPPDARGVLVIADHGAMSAASAGAATVAAPPDFDGAAGVVWATLGANDEPPHPDVPVFDSVELLGWTPAALRVWLRSELYGEPTPSLVEWVHGRSGGLPARAQRETDRLRDSGGLVRAESGAWTLAPHVLARARRPRPRLPESLTELIGRQAETAQVASLLSERRLVTLVGPGGIGKTRLSLAVAGAVADDFADGAVFVPLADATSEALVVSGIARALEVAAVPGQALLETVREHLAETATLLMLDNFEQVLDAAPVLSDLLAAAPGVKILISSRERLGLYGEQAYPVPPLGLPEPEHVRPGPEGVARALAASPALALFNTRARAAAYGFALGPQDLISAIDLCRRLDGLPLAIELAASRCDTLTPAEMLAQVEERLDLPGEGPRDLPARQRTLRGAIDWSVDLLEPAERDLFTRLGAFAGGFRLDAVAALDDGPSSVDVAKRLDVLVEKSLVYAEADSEGDLRYATLETIRAYAIERLANEGTAATVFGRHAELFAALAERAGGELVGPRQARWAGRVEREYQNLRVAFRRARDAGSDETAARITLGLWRFWRAGNHIGEGREWLVELLDGRDPSASDATRARLLHAAAVLAGAQDDHQTAFPQAYESMVLAERVGDAHTMAAAYNALGISALAAGHLADARRHFQASLGIWRDHDATLGMAIAHGNLTKVALRLGDLDAASEHASRCLALDRQQGNTRGIMLGLICLGEIQLGRGDTSGARGHLDEALTLGRELGDVFGEALALHLVGEAARHEGDTAEARRHVGAALALRRDVGDRENLAISLEALGGLLLPDAPDLAARLFGAAEALRNRYHLPVPGGAQDERSATIDLLHSVSGVDAVAAAWNYGATTPLDAVVDEALARITT
jgi:diguanylate cyclase (GGDEF)-like protein